MAAKVKPAQKTSRTFRSGGFTLMELMIVVAIIAILSTLAMPSYKDYITRGRIGEATSNLAAWRVRMEQYYQDNKTYACISLPTSIRYFTFRCIVGPATAPDNLKTTFTLTATGASAMTGFTFTVNQDNVKATVAPSGWTSSTTCWVTDRSGSC